MSLFRRKPLDVLIAEGGDEAHGLKKTLTAVDLLALGIGAIIGAGIFATLGSATSGGTGAPPAGPGVVVSILLTALCCGFCALCYAEFASLVPIAGSAYTYSYATLGELVAWIIGWDLILEYAVGNIAVAISWAAYFRQLMAGFGVEIPAWMATDYRSRLGRGEGRRRRGRAGGEPGGRDLGLSPELAIAYQAHHSHPTLLGIPIVCNLLSVLITALITWLLVIGIKESARFNNVVVVLKLVTLLFFIGVGAFFVKPANWHPFFPGGVHGVWTGRLADLLRLHRLRRHLDRGRGVQGPGPRHAARHHRLADHLHRALRRRRPRADGDDPLRASSRAWRTRWRRRSRSSTRTGPPGLLAFGAVVAMTAVLLVFQLGQPRILMAMSRDGLLSPWFAKIHPNYRTPHVTTILTGVFVGFFAAVANIDEIVQLTNIGTLFAFVLVCIGILILRRAGAGPAAAVPRPLRAAHAAPRDRDVPPADGGAARR